MSAVERAGTRFAPSLRAESSAEGADSTEQSQPRCPGYAQDEPGGYAAGARYFPDDMPQRRYDQPAPPGLEIKIGEAPEARRASDRTARGAGGS